MRLQLFNLQSLALSAILAIDVDRENLGELI
jgi:hypothetical protein